MEKKKTIILVATHEKCPLPENPPFFPIQVGKKIAKNKFNMPGDNTGDNISHKNANYCELTALYWAWKNINNIDYIGLNHYRRYFCERQYLQHSQFINTDNWVEFINNIKLPKYENILEKKDIILVKPFTYHVCIEEILVNILSKEDLQLLRNVIKEKYPDYLETYNNFMLFNNKISSCNMFITNYYNFNNYCNWLFDILFELEKRVIISQYQTASRIFGFLGEALINIYCIKNKLKVAYLPIYVIRDELKNESNVIYLLKNMRKNMSFLFNKPKRR